MGTALQRLWPVTGELTLIDIKQSLGPSSSHGVATQADPGDAELAAATAAGLTMSAAGRPEPVGPQSLAATGHFISDIQAAVVGFLGTGVIAHWVPSKQRPAA